MSNEKEMFERFCEIVKGIRCENCPVKEKCHDESTATEDFQHTCEETVWHYVKTGTFLLWKNSTLNK